nr:immunoglobulin heavy chain junction region [Mus musculus]
TVQDLPAMMVTSLTT